MIEGWICAGLLYTNIVPFLFSLVEKFKESGPKIGFSKCSQLKPKNVVQNTIKV